MLGFFFLGAGLTSPLFGILAVCHFRTASEYMIPSVAFLLPMFTLLLYYFRVVKSLLFYVLTRLGDGFL